MGQEINFEIFNKLAILTNMYINLDSYPPGVKVTVVTTPSKKLLFIWFVRWEGKHKLGNKKRTYMKNIGFTIIAGKEH